MIAIESSCSWATLASFTEANVPCFEDGSNCNGSGGSGVGSVAVVDPSIAADPKAFLAARFA